VSALKGHRRRLLVGGILAVILLYFFFRGLDWGALKAAFRSANPLLLAGIFLTTILIYMIRAWRWGGLLAPLARVPFRDLFPITMTGFASALVIPRAGEFVRPYLVGRRHRIPAVAAFSSIVLERLLDLATVLTLFELYLFVLPPPAAQRGGAVLATFKVAGAFGALGTVALLAILWVFHVHAERIVPWLDRLMRWLPHAIATRLSQALHSFADGLAVLRAPARHLLVLLGQSLLLWLTIATSFHLNHLAFGLGLPFHATFLLIGFLTVGVAIPTPGMVGGFHEFYLLALTEGFGIAHGTAAAAGITAHALTNLPVLVLGLFFLWREGLTLGAMARMTDEQGAAAGGAEPPATTTGADPGASKEEEQP
jgi:uncharacterized protein (TIRG00374 family)